jgi:hypothetical protein
MDKHAYVITDVYVYGDRTSISFTFANGRSHTKTIMHADAKCDVDDDPLFTHYYAHAFIDEYGHAVAIIRTNRNPDTVPQRDGPGDA